MAAGPALALYRTAIDVAPLLAALLLVALVVYSLRVVGDDELLVFTEDGEVERTFDSGFHLLSPFRGSGRSISVTPSDFRFTGGRAETADGVPVAVDVSGTVQVVDAQAIALHTEEYPGDVQRRIGQAVETQVGYVPWDELEASEFEAACRRELAPVLDTWGVELAELSVERLQRIDDG